MEMKAMRTKKNENKEKIRLIILYYENIRFFYLLLSQKRLIKYCIAKQINI